jgi:O-antigen ligase
MATRTIAAPAAPRLPQASPSAVSIAALLSALLVGVLLSRSVPLGVAAVMGLCYAPLVLLNLRLGVALWLPLTFLEGVPVFNLGGKAAGLLIAAAWFGALRTTGPRAAALIGRHRRTIAVLAAYLVWITLSLAWADSPGAAAEDLWHWYVVALIFVVVATVAVDAATVRLLMHLFVVGAVLSIVFGSFLGGLGGGGEVDLESEASGRLYGASGDPNILAAGLIPAAVFAAGLAATTRAFATRVWLLGAIGILGLGIIASESRGGLVASGATLLAALIFFRRRRAYVLLLCLLMLGLGGAWMASSPTAWDRLTHFDDGSGRTSIWKVATRVIDDHPVTGAGLNNFAEVSGDYTRQPGQLEFIHFIVDRPHLAHNVYLETAANTGFVGLALFLGFIAGCLYAAWAAGRRFERLREDGLEALSRAVLVGGIGFMAAAVFLSAGVDKRLWALLGLGPALYGIAVRRR